MPSPLSSTCRAAAQFNYLLEPAESKIGQEIVKEMLKR
jgi:hypothetical protein